MIGALNAGKSVLLRGLSSRRARSTVAEHTFTMLNPCCDFEVLVLKRVRNNEWYFQMEKFRKTEEIAREERKKHEGMRAKESGSGKNGKSTTKN